MDSLFLFLRKLWFLVRRPAFRGDLEEEMAFHLEQAERELAGDGLNSEQAHRAAALQFGNATRAREASLETVAFSAETAWQDLRYGARQLRKNPGFAATSILIFSLGIGATSAIFSVVDPILFEPLPYPQPRRIMSLWEMRSDGSPLAPSYGAFQGLKERSRSFQAMAAFKPWQPTATGGGEPERLEGQSVTPDYFRVLGVAPALGRDFQPADDQFNGPRLVLLSHGLWQRRFNSDRTLVGRQITLNDTLYTVIGIMPAAFENVLAPAAELWSPLQYDPSLVPSSREWGHHLRIVARLREDRSRAQARAEIDALLPPLARAYAAGFESTGGAPRGILIEPLQKDVTRAVRPALLAVMGAVLLVLMIACVNLTNLQLARGGQRAGEFALRAALGAVRSRMLRQVLTESLLLAVIGGALGLLVARLGTGALLALSRPELPRLSAIAVNGTVFMFGAVITTISGIAAGLVPALQAARSDPQSRLQQGARTTTGGHQLTRRILVVAQVALALVLLISAGLLLRSVQHIFAIDPGFNAQHLLTMEVQISGKRFDEPAMARFFAQALKAVERVPGVAAAAFTSQLPLSGDSDGYGVQFEKESAQRRTRAAFRYAVTPDYFTAMQIPLRRGRLLNHRDAAGSPLAVVINESLARSVFGDADPLGQRLRAGPSVDNAKLPWSVIVGVVGDVKQASLAVTGEDAFYVSSAQWYWTDNSMALVVRTPGEAAALAGPVRAAVWSVDKDQPILRVATMRALLTRSQAQRRFALIWLEAFALLALVLAASGIYGLLSGSVTERMRELGVRAALGASRGNNLALVLRQGMALTLAGVLIGLAGAIAASQALVSLLFGVSQLDPMTYLGVIAMVYGVAALACWLPARRAAKVEPSLVLRAE